MSHLLLALYPASWRTRYGEEFELILADRPLGPFDVADVLLGALDAHLHLRGLGAASQHAKGFAMSLRIGGWAAIAGGPLWFLGLAGASADANDGPGPWSGVMVAGTAALLVALTGLSAFQARRYPRLTWAAFALPAIGIVVSAIGAVAMAVVGDRPFLGDLSPWYVWMSGTITMFVGSGLFAVATWRTPTLSRRAAGLLAVSSVAVFAAVPAMTGLFAAPDAVITALFVVAMAAFVGGWIALGTSALRIDRSISSTLQGAN
ncbi:MAG: hypothetical protein A2V85_17275 [Chloroflexi bacterium RBG_16_72_14]|nr:MAG: hypothetical protein A2V85_17275 [Chloroflexi bacterium RBG_16_72_14]